VRETRHVLWDPKHGARETPVWDWDGLAPGNRIVGPAIVESRHTTYVIEPGWTFQLDAHRIGILEKGAP
jgi:N-methylhydantoinase A/oxoprolinase/acetone carboxylase beta subunit